MENLRPSERGLYDHLIPLAQYERVSRKKKTQEAVRLVVNLLCQYIYLFMIASLECQNSPELKIISFYLESLILCLCPYIQPPSQPGILSSLE